MSLLKQLLSPFIEFDDPNKVAPKSAGTTTSSPNAAPNAKPRPVTPTQGVSKPSPVPVPQQTQHPLISDDHAPIEINETPKYSANGTLTGPLPQHEKYFEELIETANKSNPYFAGNDYKEFVDSKLDIDDIADESLKYQTAFNIFKAAGLTKERLLRTANEYINVIGRDLNAFQSAHAQRYKKELGEKESDLKKKVEKLQVVLQQVNQLKSEINTLSQDIALEAEKLNTLKTSFIIAGEKKQDEISGEIEKIKRYFPG